MARAAITAGDVTGPSSLNRATQRPPAGSARLGWRRDDEGAQERGERLHGVAAGRARAVAGAVGRARGGDERAEHQAGGAVHATDDVHALLAGVVEAGADAGTAVGVEHLVATLHP